MDKLYLYYADGLLDFSVGSVFQAALAEKAATENPKLRTLEKNRGDFKRFIPANFASKDIRTITDIDLKRFIQEWVNREHPKPKTFLSFKGILNLIFEYAYLHRLIAENPVTYVKNKPYMKSCDTTKATSEQKIFSAEEICLLKDEVIRRITSGQKRYGDYYVNGYAMLFAIETGVRVGELCALKWADVHETYIHIHAQQLYQTVEGKKEIYYAPYTKNEKGISEDGRQFPLTAEIERILTELKSKQEELGIESEFIFCNRDGRWMIETVRAKLDENQNSDLGTQREPKNIVPFVPRDEDLRPWTKGGSIAAGFLWSEDFNAEWRENPFAGSVLLAHAVCEK